MTDDRQALSMLLECTVSAIHSRFQKMINGQCMWSAVRHRGMDSLHALVLPVCGIAARGYGGMKRMQDKSI